MTQTEINSIMQELITSLRGMDIPLSRNIAPDVQINTRAKRRLGCCFKKPVAGGFGSIFIIEVSASVIDDEEKLRETLCHELLHTCRGCQNHGEKWKAYAKTVGESLGYDIQRLAKGDPETVPLRRENIKYVLECQSCGKKIYRSRMSKAVKYPNRYRCPCGGKLKLYAVD